MGRIIALLAVLAGFTAAQAATIDPIVGRWMWGTRAVVVKPDQTATSDFGTTGRWKPVQYGSSQRTYQFTWEHDSSIDSVALSEDAKSAEIRSSLGAVYKATRLSHVPKSDHDAGAVSSPGAAEVEVSRLQQERVLKYVKDLEFLMGFLLEAKTPEFYQTVKEEHDAYANGGWTGGYKQGAKAPGNALAMRKAFESDLARIKNDLPPMDQPGSKVNPLPSTTAPTANIVMPSTPREETKKKPSPQMPPEVIRLGVLANGLVAYFPMDARDHGGLRWSQIPLTVEANAAVQFREEGGRKFADFSHSGARTLVTPPLPLAPHYTLAAWVETPAPVNHGIVWHGSHGVPLMVLEKALGYYHEPTQREGRYTEISTPVHGWHHMAVEFDGEDTQAFLDGKPLDRVQGNVSKDLWAIGNFPGQEHQHWMMASGIDEMYVFSRTLRPEELVVLARFGDPIATKPDPNVSLGGTLTGSKASSPALTAPPSETSAALLPNRGPALGSVRPSGGLIGHFYVNIDDDVWLFVNGEQIFHNSAVGRAQSPVAHLGLGDRVTVRLLNRGGDRYFTMAFASLDKSKIISFRHTDFKILPDFDARDFAASALGSIAGVAKEDRGRTKQSLSLFPFKHHSESIWGEFDQCCLACVVTPPMITEGTTIAGAAPPRELEILDAKYGVPGRTVDVTEKLRTRIFDNAIRIGPGQLQPDPAFGIVKSLVIRYKYGSEEKTVTVNYDDLGLDIP